MKQNLKQSFFQVFTVVFIWLTFVLTRFLAAGTTVPIHYLWNIAGGTFIFALLFGVMYNALWYHLTLKPIWNILIATVANTAGGLMFLWLVFRAMFWLVWRWSPAMLLLSLVLHIIAFHFYSKYENKKQVELLNKALENN